MKSENDDARWLWGFTLGAVILVYFYFFVFLPQSWTLNNDYAWLVSWRKTPHDNFLKEGLLLTIGDFSQGRFHPIYNFFVKWQYATLPLTPLCFRIVKIIMAIASGFLLADILKTLRLSLSAILFSEVLFAANLSMKEWIILTGALESLATFFFLLSLSLFLRQRRAWSALAFIIMILSKENYFSLFPVFLWLFWFEIQNQKPKFKLNLKQWGTLAAFTIPSIAFVLFVLTLPRVYTGSHFHIFAPMPILKALFLPPLKSFGPAFLLIGYMIWKNKNLSKLSSQDWKVIGLGLWIIVPFTILLAGWGSFDSWLYLHITIPVGWAILLSYLWDKFKYEKKDFVFTGLAFLTGTYLILSTINGSNNTWTFLSEAKSVAEIACADKAQNPSLKIFSNCEEGSGQLKSYLEAYNVCAKPPEFEYFKGALPKTVNKPFEVIYASRWCDPAILDQTFNSKIDFRFWSVLKSF